MIWRDEALLFLWLVSVIVAGCCWEATAAWARRRRVTRSSFSRLDLAGRIVTRARRVNL